MPGWLERGEGYFLATASAAGLLTQIGSAPYAVSKHAAVAFAEWLSVTYGDRGLRVSCLCPMGVNTPMLNPPASRRHGEHGGNVVKAAGEVLEPEQVADDRGRRHRRGALPDPPPPRGAHLPPAQDRRLRPVAGRHAPPPGPRRRRVKAVRGCRRPLRAADRRGLAQRRRRPPRSRSPSPRVATSARLQPDATMDVAEEVTYDFAGGPFTVGIRSFEAGSLAQITDFAVTDENGNALATTPPDAVDQRRVGVVVRADERRRPHVHRHVRRGRRRRGRARRRRALLEVPRHRPPGRRRT